MLATTYQCDGNCKNSRGDHGQAGSDVLFILKYPVAHALTCRTVTVRAAAVKTSRQEVSTQQERPSLCVAIFIYVTSLNTVYTSNNLLLHI